MNNIEEKERIVRDLVDTFEDRNHLHIAYKNKLKGILLNFSEFSMDILFNLPDAELKNFGREDMQIIIDEFVEMMITKQE